MPRRKYLQLDDHVWLHRLYVVEQRSCGSIAAIVGCSPGAVKSALKGHDIPLRSGLPYQRRPVRATVRDPDLAARLGLKAGIEVIA